MTSVEHRAKPLSLAERKQLEGRFHQACLAYAVSSAIPHAINRVDSLLPGSRVYQNFQNATSLNLVMFADGIAQVKNNYSEIPRKLRWVPNAIVGLDRIARNVMHNFAIPRGILTPQSQFQEREFTSMVEHRMHVGDEPVNGLDKRTYLRKLAIGEIIIPGFVEATNEAQAAHPWLFSLAEAVGLELVVPDNQRVEQDF